MTMDMYLPSPVGHSHRSLHYFTLRSTTPGDIQVSAGTEVVAKLWCSHVTMTKTPTSWTHPLKTLTPQSKCHLPGTDASCHIPCGPASKLDLKKADKWRKNQAWKWALRWICFQFSSVTQLCPTLCYPMDCMQYIRLPCASPTPRAYSNSCPSSGWCQPTISSSVVPFSSWLLILAHNTHEIRGVLS